MSDKKNIERLFQEKFKDFESAAPSHSWEYIASQLEKKKNKKKITPLWYKMSGVAVLLLVGYIVTDYFLSSPIKAKQNIAPSVVTNDNNELKKNQNSDSVIKVNSDETETKIKSVIVSNENTPEEDQYKKNKENPRSLDPNFGNSNTKESIVSNKQEENKLTLSSSKKNSDNDYNFKSNYSNKSQKIIVEKGNNKNHSIDEKSTKNIDKKANSNTSLVNNDNNKNEIDDTLVTTNKKKSKNLIVQNRDSHVELVANEKNINKNKPDDILVTTNEKKSKNSVVQNKTTIDTGKTTFETPSNQIVEKLKMQSKDSVTEKLAVVNPLETIEKESIIKKENKQLVKTNRWKIKPNVAPIVMRATEGSPIASQFKDNAKNYENNLSVGIGVDYAVSRKLAIRTGVNKFNVGYNTTDIAYYADIVDNSSKKSNNNTVFKNINLISQAQNVIIEDKTTITTANQSNLNPSIQAELATQDKNEGYLNQQMGYVEVPVELAYTLLDKKFGIHVFTGLSTLFLEGNKISIVSSNLTTTIGEANNLNRIHFSSNVGVGFKYSFWNAFEANFEPTLKYQLNPFNSNSGNFKPYLIGFYTGVSFNF